MPRFHVVTLFPQVIESYLQVGILSRAAGQGLVSVECHQLRDYAVDRYGHIDGKVFGGGKGMLFRPEPLNAQLKAIKDKDPQTKVVYLTPQGRRFDNKLAREMAAWQSVTLIAARYEGIDARITRKWCDLELCTGDFVLTGGELPALCVIDAVTRFVDGSIKADSANEDSFENGLLEHDHYTEPAEFEGMTVPDLLRSGRHADIEEYRKVSSLEKTYANRPDLLLGYPFPLTERGSTENPLKILKRQNDSYRSWLRILENSAKEYKNVRRNKESQERSGSGSSGQE